MAKQKLTESQLECRKKLSTIFDELGPLRNDVFLAAKSIAYDKPLLYAQECGVEVETEGLFGQTKRKHVRFSSPGDSIKIWAGVTMNGEYTRGWLQFNNTQDIINNNGFSPNEYSNSEYYTGGITGPFLYIEDDEKILTNIDMREQVKMLRSVINDPDNEITKEKLAELIPHNATLSDWRTVRSEEMELRRSKDILSQNIMDGPESNDEQSLNELVR